MTFALLRNREPRVACGVGAIVGFATGLVFALSIILEEGGGSLSRGWNPGWSYLSFYGILMLPVLAIVGLVAVGLSRLIGGGLVMLVSILGLGTLLIHSAVSTTPSAQLARATGRSGIPGRGTDRLCRHLRYPRRSESPTGRGASRRVLPRRLALSSGIEQHTHRQDTFLKCPGA